MNKEQLIEQTNRIIELNKKNVLGGLAQAREFLETYGGKRNQFLILLIETTNSTSSAENKQYRTINILSSFKEYIENDLLRSISLEREIQIETVSDYLSQAETLLNDKKVHPAAAAVIIGCSLEEFLRNWLEEESFDISSIKNSLDAYSNQLKSLDKINKQDQKDILSWGGIRNDAAHGHWENVEDRQKIKNMLEGVNLFMRKYSK